MKCFKMCRKGVCTIEAAAVISAVTIVLIMVIQITLELLWKVSDLANECAKLMGDNGYLSELLRVQRLVYQMGAKSLI